MSKLNYRGYLKCKTLTECSSSVVLTLGFLITGASETVSDGEIDVNYVYSITEIGGFKLNAHLKLNNFVGVLLKQNQILFHCVDSFVHPGSLPRLWL